MLEMGPNTLIQLSDIFALVEFPAIYDKDYFDSQTFVANPGNNALRVYPNAETGWKAWVKIGSWSETAKAWGEMNWIMDGSVENPKDRQICNLPPAELQDKLLISDFPLILRQDHSASSARAYDALARPGTKVKIDELWLEPSDKMFSVWAKVTIH